MPTYPDPTTVNVVTAAAGILRLNPTGPSILSDSSHASVGLHSVGITSKGELLVEHAHLGPVCALIVSPDESLAGDRGVTAGGSGGGSSSVLRLHHPSIQSRRLDLTVPAEYALVSGTYCNIWFEVRQVVASS